MFTLGCIIPKNCMYAYLAPDISAIAFFFLLVSIILVLIGFLAYTICAYGTSQQKIGMKKLSSMYMHGMQVLKRAVVTLLTILKPIHQREFHPSWQEKQQTRSLLVLEVEAYK